MQTTKTNKFNKIIADIFKKKFEIKTAAELPEDWDAKRKTRLERGRESREYFFKEYFPDICYADFGKHHREWFELLDIKGKIIGMPGARSYGKTTIIAVLDSIRDICFSINRFILFVSADKDIATERIENILEIIRANKRLQSDFNFSFAGASGERIVNNTKLKARGWRQQLKGLVWGAHRPDKALVDDLYTGMDSREIEEKKLERIRGKLFGGLKNGSVFWIENMESKDSAIYMFSEVCEAEPGNKSLEIHIYRALDENGESTWKEAFSTEDMMDIRDAMGSIEFERQMQQNPIIVGKKIKKEWFKFFNSEDAEIKKRKLKKRLWSDPGGDSAKADVCDKAIALVAFDKGTYFVYRIINGKMNLKTFVDHHYDVYEEEDNIEKMYMEDNFFQNLLFRWFDDAELRKGYALPIKGKSSRVNKWLRIEQILPLLERGKILFNKKDSFLQRFINQAIAYEGEGQKHPVDALDALGSCILLFGKNGKKGKIKLFGNKIGRKSWKRK